MYVTGARVNGPNFYNVCHCLVSKTIRLPRGEQTCTTLSHCDFSRLPVTIIIMLSKKPSETNRIRKIAGYFKGKLSSLLHLLSRAPSPSSIEMDSSSNDPTRWVIKKISPTFHWKSFALLSISPINKVPVVLVDHAPAPVSLFPGLPNSVPVSGSIPMPGPKQLGSASGGGLETRRTVSGHAVLAIIVADYWSFSTCIQSPIVH